MPNLKTIAKVLTIVPDPMLLVDSQGLIVLSNVHACDMFGLTAEELVGRSVACLLPERFQASHARHVVGYFQSPEARPMRVGLELTGIRADGSEFPVEISLSPHRESNAVYALAAIRDITERKQLEEARNESARQEELAEERALASQAVAASNERLRIIFEASPIGIITTTKDGSIDHWNSAAERIYGFSANEALGMSLVEMGKAVEVRAGTPLYSVDAQGQVVSEVRDGQTRRRRKDGKIIDISLSTAQFRDANGAYAGSVFLVDDITERKMLEQQLRQAQKMEAVGQLTGGVAHDFNNLLSVIISSLELLGQQIAPHPAHLELNDTALDAAFQGADLIRQMLAFSRKQNLDPKRIEVNDLLASMTRLLARSLGEQVEVVLETSPDVWSAIADPVQLQTAVVNLATNARDAMPNGGRLVIQTGNAFLDEAYVEQFPELKAGEYVMVRVTDSGRGMDAETVERAFDPFFTTKAMGIGTGLGLSMVFGFAKQSHGHVRIYSEVGQGTTIRLYLPRAASEHVEIPLPKPVRTRKDFMSAKILIVEDNVNLAKSALRVLSSEGYTAVVASNADEALKVLRADASFDLLFTDIVLAHGLNGIELAREAIKLQPDLSVLYSSGFSEALLHESGRDIISGHFIAKPYPIDDLITRIRSLVEGKQGRRTKIPLLGCA